MIALVNRYPFYTEYGDNNAPKAFEGYKMLVFVQMSDMIKTKR